VSRHVRRRRFSQLRKVIDAIKVRGVTAEPDLVEMAALVWLLKDAIESEPVRGRSTRLVSLVAEMHDRANRRGPAWKELACKKGCFLCCDLYVSASAPQIFAIADYLREQSPDLPGATARIETTDARTRGLDIDGRSNNRTMCGLLVDGLCSVYPVRPPACRAYCSLSLAACEAGARGETDDIPIPGYTHLIRGAFDQALWTVLSRKGLSYQGYELNHAVLVALGDETLEDRWYAGENVFAAVAVDQAASGQVPPEMEATFRETLWNVAHGELPPESSFAANLPAWCLE
jgi:hypothetical protein